MWCISLSSLVRCVWLSHTSSGRLSAHRCTVPSLSGSHWNGIYGRTYTVFPLFVFHRPDTYRSAGSNPFVPSNGSCSSRHTPDRSSRPDPILFRTRGTASFLFARHIVYVGTLIVSSFCLHFFSSFKMCLHICRIRYGDQRIDIEICYLKSWLLKRMVKRLLQFERSKCLGLIKLFIKNVMRYVLIRFMLFEVFG